MLSMRKARVQSARTLGMEAGIRVLMADEVESVREHLGGILAEVRYIELCVIEREAARTGAGYRRVAA